MNVREFGSMFMGKGEGKGGRVAVRSPFFFVVYIL
jgi:hypothetical protein